MGNFVKTMDNDGEGFRCRYLQGKFLALSNDNLQAGIFTGPQITALLKDENFENSLSAMELQAWKGLKAVTQHFLESNRASTYEQLVTDMLNAF